jgi:hypothetical protein
MSITVELNEQEQLLLAMALDTYTTVMTAACLTSPINLMLIATTDEVLDVAIGLRERIAPNHKNYMPDDLHMGALLKLRIEQQESKNEPGTANSETQSGEGRGLGKVQPEDAKQSR